MSNDEFEKREEAFLQKLEKLQNSLLQMFDEKLPNIQLSSGKPKDLAPEFEPKRYRQNFSSLAARLVKVGWVVDFEISDGETLYAKLTKEGKLRFRKSGDIYLNAIPQLYYSKSKFPPVPENVVVPKRDQTLIILDLVDYMARLGPPPLSEGEIIALRAFIAWYTKKMAEENSG